MNGKLYLWGEFFILFVGIPAVYALGLLPVPKIPVLLAFSVITLVWLLRRGGFTRRDLLDGWRDNGEAFRWILLRSAMVAVFSVGAVLLIDPSLFLTFPRARPWLWLLVMVLYPLLSAYPQELIYRAFLFKRYETILPTNAARIVASVLVFSFLHVVFDNWIAVVLTIPAGFIFTRTYVRTNSLFLVSLEHALYGCIVFTSGLGRFFYTPN